MAKDLKREDYLKLVGIVLLGFALRLIVFTFFIKEPEKHFLPGGQLGDAFWYDRIAVNLMNGNGFSAALTEPYLPDSIRTPIYPVFLTIIYCLFGHKIYFAILAQIFISLITAILVFNLSKLIWRSTTAGIASMSLFIVDPDTLFISNYLLTETLFTFFVTISLFLISKQWDNESWALLIISFIIMAIATLTRPIFIYLPMVIMGVVSVRYYKLGRLKDYIWIIILSLLSYFALISIWCYRNYRTFGVFEISPIGSYNLFYYGTAGIESQRLGISIDEARKKLDDTYFNDTKFLSLNFPKKMSIARNYALKHITKYPYYFSKITVNNIIATFYLWQKL